jgi:sec-independent protein translocase protein TatA
VDRGLSRLYVFGCTGRPSTFVRSLLFGRLGQRLTFGIVVGDLLQPTHLLFVLVVALLVLGPKRLPEVGRALGRGLRDFRNAISGEESPEPTIAPTDHESSTATLTHPASTPAANHEPETPTPAPKESGSPAAHETSPPKESTEQTKAVTSVMRGDSAS